ncbi:pectinesterase/pectinesterase inhibitor 61 [Carex littledalei]|uniref:Pectinesterase/pectinesterase inhibitor 61 n=1 Tax=Carex littledalei TaxID=544730 RepID=A0A833QJK8_9POAL|nr:pectinesterase/pectinesterase inhibitor 61 [Carex littledalei]
MASMFCFVAFLSLSISVCAAQAPWNASQSLTTACNQTPSPDLCIKHLLKFNESLTADIHLLTGLMVRAAAQYATETAEKVFGEQHGALSADPVYETCLHDCSESVEDAIQQLDDTTKAVDMRAFKDVEDWVGAAVADASTCNESCKGANGEPQIKQLSDMTAEFAELCKVILALSKLDAQGQH